MFRVGKDEKELTRQTEQGTPGGSTETSEVSHRSGESGGQETDGAEPPAMP